MAISSSDWQWINEECQEEEEYDGDVKPNVEPMLSLDMESHLTRNRRRKDSHQRMEVEVVPKKTKESIDDREGEQRKYSRENWRRNSIENEANNVHDADREVVKLEISEEDNMTEFRGRDKIPSQESDEAFLKVDSERSRRNRRRNGNKVQVRGQSSSEEGKRKKRQRSVKMNPQEKDNLHRQSGFLNNARMSEEISMSNLDCVKEEPQEDLDGRDKSKLNVTKMELTSSLNSNSLGKAKADPPTRRRRKSKHGMGEGRRAEMKRRRMKRMKREQTEELRKQMKAAEEGKIKMELNGKAIKEEISEDDDQQIHASSVKMTQKVQRENHQQQRRGRVAKKTPEKKEGSLEQRKPSRKTRKEKTQRGQKSVRKDYKNYRKKLKQENPEEYEELLQKERLYSKTRRANMTEEKRNEMKIKKYFYAQAYLAKKGKFSELPEEKKQMIIQKQRERLQNLQGEKKEHYRETVCKSVTKYYKKVKEENPEKWKEIIEKQKEYLRKRYSRETPEQRERRRYKDKVCTAKRKLRMQLQNENVPEEEIKRQLDEVWVKMWKEFNPDGEVPSCKRGGPKKRNQLTSAASTSTGTISQVSQQSTSAPVSANSNKPCHNKMSSETKSVVPSSAEHEDFGDEYYEDDAPSSPIELSPSQPPPASINVTSPLHEPNRSHPQDLHKSESETIICSPETANQNIARCSHCSSALADDTQLRTHILNFHSERCWKCPKCKEVMLSPQEMSQHFQQCQNQPHKPSDPASGSSVAVKVPLRFHCMRCPLQFLPTDNRDVEDVSYGDGSNNAKCHLMGFISRENLFSHVKREHPNNFWPCHRCKLLKYSKENLKYHQTICSPQSKSSSTERDSKTCIVVDGIL